MSAKTSHRRSLRIPEYDYAATATYYIATCVQDKACVLGRNNETGVVLSVAGLLVESWWHQIGRYPSVSIDAYVIMPNHRQGLLRFGWGDDEETPPSGRGKPPCLPSPVITGANISEPPTSPAVHDLGPRTRITAPHAQGSDKGRPPNDHGSP